LKNLVSIRMKKLFNGCWRDLLALTSGGLLTLAFAPFNLYLLGILSPALLLGCWLNATPIKAFWRGWLFGLGFFGTGVYWVFNSIHLFGNADLTLSCLITGGFIMLLALFPALTGFFLNKRFSGSTVAKTLLAFPALWISAELARSYMFTGFPWLLLGYSQINSPLKGFAPLLSVYGVSLAAVISSGLLVNAALQLQLKAYNKTCLNLLVLIFIWVTGWQLSHIGWTQPLGAPIKVSLVQGNVPQEIKWSPDNIQPTLDLYLKLTEPLWNSKIIIWPEAAIPITLQDAADYVQILSDKATQHQSTLIAGIPVKATHADGYYNAVIALGKDKSFYLKRHLVPFGEYTPFPSILNKLLGSLNIPMSDFIPGAQKPTLLMANGIKIVTYICYEVAYAEQAIYKDDTIGLMLTVTNDAWFGRSIAQAQHLQIAQMRALELGRPLLFVGNNGITAIISSHGAINANAPPFKTFVLTDNIQPMWGRTPWQQLALDPILILLMCMLLSANKLNQLANSFKSEK